MRSTSPAGRGRNAVWLAERGCSVTGVDFSRVALEKAALMAAARKVEVEWVHGDVLEYEPAEASADLVVVLYLQVPAEERREVLRRAAAALAPGGTLLVVAHDRGNLEHGYGGPRDPVVLPTAEEVATDLAGLELVLAGTVLGPVATPDGERLAVDLLVHARRPFGPMR